MRLWCAAASVIVALAATPSQGQSHAFINSMRSGTVTHVFVSQSVEGEYSHHHSAEAPRQTWQGYGMRSALGLELLKFVDFSIAHTFVNTRNRDVGYEILMGSRLEGEARFVFASPVGNLEAGGGAVASKLDYQKQLDSTTYYGSGYYYMVGWNYFMSSRVSLFGSVRMRDERLLRNHVTAQGVNDRSTEATAVGLGFSLWL